jgi:hypothetical protein
MYPLGAAGGGPAGNSGEGQRRSGRGRRGTGLRVASGWFGGSVGARSSREGGHAGGPGRWPRRWLSPTRLRPMHGNRRWRQLSGMLEGGWDGSLRWGGRRWPRLRRPGRWARARAGEGIRALYSRPARRLRSCGPKGGALGTQVPGDGERTAGQADDRTAARRSSDLGIRATWGRGGLGERTLGRRVRVRPSMRKAWARGGGRRRRRRARGACGAA